MSSVYVSGVAISTAQSLERRGLSLDQIADASCARTFWENATRTADTLCCGHPGTSVVLITYSWQVPRRASAAFRHQGLDVQLMPGEPSLDSVQRNRMSLRETVSAVLYALQRRF